VTSADVTDQQRHILVVEDEDDLAALVQLNLELSGYDVSVVSDGQQAMDVLPDVGPDLVLLDVMMPVKDGWQVLRELKSDPEHQDIPVVMLTALAEERDLIRGHLQGAVRYVTKPFEMRELLETIDEALAEPDDAERQARRQRTKELLSRLAELDSGRSKSGPQINLSRLENPPAPAVEAAPVSGASLEVLTEHQRYVAEQLAAGRAARDLADELDVSRSNIYATRKRIARKLGVAPEQVAAETRRLLGR
jgi:DNA-binding response OmpR family regulator